MKINLTISALSAIQQRTRKFHIEELNQRPHKKGSDERSESGKQAAEGADDDADQVASDPAETERLPAFVGDNDRNCIINRDTQIGRHI